MSSASGPCLSVCACSWFIGLSQLSLVAENGLCVPFSCSRDEVRACVPWPYSSPPTTRTLWLELHAVCVVGDSARPVREYSADSHLLCQDVE